MFRNSYATQVWSSVHILTDSKKEKTECKKKSLEQFHHHIILREEGFEKKIKILKIKISKKNSKKCQKI